MVLTDKDILKNKLIENIDIDNLQAASYDLTLPEEYRKLLKPHEVLTVHTKERINLPDNICAKTFGKSSFARLGISSGDLGGWVDPGFNGNLTLSIINHTDQFFNLAGKKTFCQIVFFKTTQSAEKIYNGHYQDSNGKVESIFA